MMSWLGLAVCALVCMYMQGLPSLVERVGGATWNQVSDTDEDRACCWCRFLLWVEKFFPMDILGPALENTL